jgi:hypothetical protein
MIEQDMVNVARDLDTLSDNLKEGAKEFSKIAPVCDLEVEKIIKAYEKKRQDLLAVFNRILKIQSKYSELWQ